MLLLLFILVSVAYCQITPSGCSQYSGVDPTACNKCLKAGCGWCNSLRKCTNGTATGPTAENGKCLIGWVFGDDNFCPSCSKRTSCEDCMASPNCVACNDGRCLDLTNTPLDKTCQPKLSTACTCGALEHCTTCEAAQGCAWCEGARRCFSVNSKVPEGCPTGGMHSACAACSAITNCQFCAQHPGCGWCGGKCEANTVCNANSDPPALANCDEYCRTQKSCEPCVFTPGCSWCQDKGECEGSDILSTTPCKLYSHSCPRAASFDAGSFVGGMALVVGLAAAGVLGFFIFKYYTKRASYSEV